jgi:hypothetical protein
MTYFRSMHLRSKDTDTRFRLTFVPSRCTKRKTQIAIAISHSFNIQRGGVYNLRTELAAIPFYMVHSRVLYIESTVHIPWELTLVAKAA